MVGREFLMLILYQSEEGGYVSKKIVKSYFGFIYEKNHVYHFGWSFSFCLYVSFLFIFISF